jgi:hypothetical protein
MKLNLRALVVAGAILWGGVFFMMSVANAVCSGYGEAFISLMASVYPGYHGTASVVDVIVGTLYAAFDGAVLWLAFGLLYNCFASRS